MNFIEAVRSCFKKYAVVRGRASRSEFWYWMLFTFLVTLVTQIFDVAVLHKDPDDQILPLTTATDILFLLPSLCASIRRLHDIDRSGRWYYISFTIIGIIYPLLVWFCRKGTVGQNRFGADPLASP